MAGGEGKGRGEGERRRRGEGGGGSSGGMEGRWEEARVERCERARQKTQTERYKNEFILL